MTLIIAPAVTPEVSKPIDGDTLLVYLIDRSGSMTTCWEETIGGLNKDIAVQKESDDGNTEVVFYFFDGKGFGYNETNMVKPFEGKLTEAIVFDSSPSAEYAPCGSTPLYDAVGKMIHEVSGRIDSTEHNPNILVSIFTDGGNTDHHGYSADEVKQMVEHRNGWTFTYFGANQDAWAVGNSFGVARGNTVSYSTDNMMDTMVSASAARATSITNAKAAFRSGEQYATASFFADAGQSASDYK